MRTRPRWWLALCAVVALRALMPGNLTARQAPAPTVNELLRRAGTYLDAYGRAMSAVVAVETYKQWLSGGGPTRDLRSEYLVISEPTGWYGFRDVFEVDGRAVRDHDDRLASLFLKPRANPMEQARRIVEEGARYNLNPPDGGVQRNINSPYMALHFLRADRQSRSTFSLAPDQPSDPQQMTLAFQERLRPRVISTPDGAPATGTFTLDTATGRVLASTLRIVTGGVRIRLEVAFGDEPRLSLSVPVAMDEEYVLPSRRARILGRATYSNFRQFSVSTSEQLKKHPDALQP